MPKYISEGKVRRQAEKLVGNTAVTAWAKEHGVNASQLSNYLTGYLPTCPPKLQQILGIRRVTVYEEVN
jgi:hypothetical protein